MTYLCMCARACTCVHSHESLEESRRGGGKECGTRKPPKLACLFSEHQPSCCTRRYTYIYTGTHTHAHEHAHAHNHQQTHVRSHTYACTRTHARAHKHANAHNHQQTHARTHTHPPAHTNTTIGTRIHTHTYLCEPHATFQRVKNPLGLQYPQTFCTSTHELFSALQIVCQNMRCC